MAFGIGANGLEPISSLNEPLFRYEPGDLCPPPRTSRIHEFANRVDNGWVFKDPLWVS